MTLLFLSVSLGFFTIRPISAQDEYQIRLKQVGIETNFESIKKYFEDLKPGPEKLRRVRELVTQLASDTFQERHKAMLALVSVPALPRTELTSVDSAQDMELEWRIQQILRKSDEQKEDVFAAVLQAIDKHDIKGLYGSILESMQEFKIEKNEIQLHKALAATYTKEDFAVAKSGLRSSSVQTKKLSIFVLIKNAPASIDQLFDGLIEQQTDELRLFAAKNLANIGNRSSLKLLVGLLESKDLSIRSKSISVLRRFTKQNFEFVAYADAEARIEKLNRWQTWLKDSSKNATLHFPLKGMEVPFTGKFLVCNYSKNFIFTINEKGEVLWKKDNINHPWGAQVLPNGNFLVVACTGKRIYEFTPEGKEVWQVDGINGSPLSVQRLEDGNTLVSTGSAGKVVEYGVNKKVVREINIGGFVADAQRLENGRTLITRYRMGKIVEVDLAGKVLWELDGYRSPRSARRLPNGNTLIAENGNKRVIEVDRKGKVVFELDNLFAPYDAFRLEDGRTVVTGARSIQMFDRKGKMQWSHAQMYSSRIFPF